VSILLALAACSGGGGAQTLQTATYTSSQTITIPAGVTNLVSVSGQGAPGTPGTSTLVQQYSKTRKDYVMRNDLGGQIYTYTYETTYSNGPKPDDYCQPVQTFYSGDVENYQQTCYEHADTSYYDSTPATTGANTTGFGQTFPGGVGKAATSVSVANVAVTPGGQYALVIPAGGSITISYY
jgi:hypothetical protein